MFHASLFNSISQVVKLGRVKEHFRLSFYWLKVRLCAQRLLFLFSCLYFLHKFAVLEIDSYRVYGVFTMCMEQTAADTVKGPISQRLPIGPVS